MPFSVGSRQPLPVAALAQQDGMTPCDLPVMDLEAEIVGLNSACNLIREHARMYSVAAGLKARHDIAGGPPIPGDHIAVSGTVAGGRVVPEVPHRPPVAPVDSCEIRFDHSHRTRRAGGGRVRLSC